MPQINLALLLAAIILITNSKFCSDSSVCADQTICLNSSCRDCQTDYDCATATPLTPACKTSGNTPGTCKQCTSNKYCLSPNASRCAANNTCSQCQVASDCYHLPGRKRQCLSGQCVECLNNGDCTSGSCVDNHCQGTLCSLPTDCMAFPTLPYCDTNCRSCGSNPSFCTWFGKVCHPEGSCEQCWTDTNCKAAATSRCNNKICTECINDSQCGHIFGKSKCQTGKGCVECKTKSDCGPGKFCFENSCISTGKDLEIKIYTQESPFVYLLEFPPDLVVNANIEEGAAIQLVNIDSSLYSYTLTKNSDTEYQITFKVSKTIPSTIIYLVFTYYSETQPNPEPRPQWIAQAKTKRMPYIPNAQSSAIESMKSAGEATVITFTATTGAFVIIGGNPILLWALVNLLQTFYYLSFISVSYPGNALFFLKIFTICNFNFIPNPMEWFDSNINNESLSAPDTFLEYDVNGLFLGNVGNLLLAWVLVILLYVSSVIYVKYFYRISRLITILAVCMIRWFKWSGVIRTLVTSYPQIIQAAFLQIRVLNTDSTVYSVSSIFGVFFSGFAFVFPICVYFMIRKLSRNPSEFNKKYTALIDDFKTEDKYAKYFNCIFLIKRLIIMLCLVFLEESPFVQIVLLIGLNISTIVMLCKTQPYINRIENIVNIVIEILFTMVHLLIFALVHDDGTSEYSEERRWNIGWGLIGICGTIALISLGLSGIEMYTTGKEFWHLAKRLYKNTIHKKESVKIENRRPRSKKVAPAPPELETTTVVELKNQNPPETIGEVAEPDPEPMDQEPVHVEFVIRGDSSDTMAQNMSMSALFEMSYKKRRVDRQDNLRGSHMLDHIRGISFETT